MKNIFTIALVFVTANLFAQTTASVQVFKDPRIDILVKKQSETNNVSTRNSAKRRSAKGYRLLVVSTNNRNEAIAARTKILTYFPELKAYMWFQSPYYKVKAGNFVERSDAQAYQKRMASLFPGNIFIMNDVVEVKPEDIEDKDE